MNRRKQKKYQEILEIVRNHECEDCAKDYKRHLLNHWLFLINKGLPKYKRVVGTRSLSKIFRMMRSEGIYSERFLLGKGKVQIEDNFYVYKRKGC